MDRLEEGGGSGEEGGVLNIGVVFLRVLEMKRRQKTKTYGIVGDKVVDVVTALPPSDGETAAKVGDEHGNESVYNKVGGNGEMSTIVGGKHELMLSMLDMEYLSERGWGHTQNNPRKMAEVRYQP